jgi:hypothetical protein
MKAVVFAGTRSVEVREVPDAVLEERPRADQAFDQRADGVIKAVLNP